MRTRYTTETIKEKFIEIHNDLYDYSLVLYKTMHKKVIVICSKHGQFEITPHMHISRKQKCAKCAFEKQQNRQKDTTENFILKAKKMHGNRYDYSLVEYGASAHEKVKVICKIHGAFMISPNSHLSKKANCLKCSLTANKRKQEKQNNSGWNKTQWIKRCSNKIATLYILKCFNEEEAFIKIGITSTSLQRRYTTVNRMPYNYEVLRLIQSENAGYIYDLEKILLRNSKEFRYIPKISFNGSTECRTLNFNYAEAH